MVIPVTAGPSGIVSQLFRKYLENIPGKKDFKEVHNKATMSTAHRLLRVQM